MIRRSWGSRLFDWCNVAFFVVCGFVMVFPLWNILMMSLVGPAEFYARTVILWPRHIDLTSYRFLFSEDLIYHSFLISTIVTVVGSAYSLLLTTLLAYPLSKKQLPGRTILLLLITITIFFQGGLIPFYLLIKQLHLMNTLAVLILPAGVSVWNFLVAKTFFAQLPVELEDAAKIDGAGDFRIFLRVVLPLSLPVLATFSLFYAVSYWNSWFNVVLFIHDKSLYTLQYVLREMIVQNANPASMVSSSTILHIGDNLFQEGVKMATIVVAVVPILCVYPFLQKYFVKGMMIGSIKG